MDLETGVWMNNIDLRIVREKKNIGLVENKGRTLKACIVQGYAHSALEVMNGMPISMLAKLTEMQPMPEREVAFCK
jgi:hypothetical protein